MSFLLDTHILMALVEEQTDKYSFKIRRILQKSPDELRVSVVSLWEIAIKWRLGKLKLGLAPKNLPSLLAGIDILLLAINEHHVLETVDPEPPTRDPFDRLLLAQCQVEGFRLVTVDRALAGHPLAA